MLMKTGSEGRPGKALGSILDEDLRIKRERKIRVECNIQKSSCEILNFGLQTTNNLRLCNLVSV